MSYTFMNTLIGLVSAGATFQTYTTGFSAKALSFPTILGKQGVSPLSCSYVWADNRIWFIIALFK